MSKMIIIEGNSNDKDNVRNFMVKGERGDDGVSPTFETSKTGDTATITIHDVEGTHEVELKDGYSPTILTSKEGGVTTITINTIEGTETAEIDDGVDLTGGVPTNGVIGWESSDPIPNGYEVSSFGDDVYSSTEFETNKKWNNKTIYRKVVTALMPSSNGGKITSFTGLNADEIFIDEAHSYFTFSNGNKIPLNYYSNATDWTRCYWNSTEAYLNFGSSVSSNVSSITLTLEYTKN